MTAHRPLQMFASDATASKLLDMTRPQFLALVEAGSLPRPVAHGRWDVSELSAIMRGVKPKPSEEFEL